MRSRVLFVLVLAPLASACGLVASQRDFDGLAARNAALEKAVNDDRAYDAKLRADLDALRDRLDNALKANADTGEDLVASKRRVNELEGKLDEANHSVDELKKDLGSTRTEIYSRMDDLKRALDSQKPAPPPPSPPPLTIPAEKTAHFAALSDAYAKKDWVTVRALGPEYVNRYPQDDKADDALYLEGNADLQDNRPSSALGSYNRLLRLYPRSNLLDKTLLDIGDAYLMLHDCQNAKLAFGACENHFKKEPIAKDARARITKIDSATPASGLCAPP